MAFASTEFCCTTGCVEQTPLLLCLCLLPPLPLARGDPAIVLHVFRQFVRSDILIVLVLIVGGGTHVFLRRCFLYAVFCMVSKLILFVFAHYTHALLCIMMSILFCFTFYLRHAFLISIHILFTYFYLLPHVVLVFCSSSYTIFLLGWSICVVLYLPVFPTAHTHTHLHLHTHTPHTHKCAFPACLIGLSQIMFPACHHMLAPSCFYSLAVWLV